MSTALAPAPRPVMLYGHLGRQFGRVFHLAVANPAEAVRALRAVLPGFDRAFLGRDGRAAYHVLVGRGAQRRDLAAGEVAQPLGTGEPIRLVPVVQGAKRQGALQTIVGYVLMVAGAVVSAYGYVPLGNAISSLGYSMMLGGVIQMLSPQRVGRDQGPENLPSYAFDGPVNYTEQGGPVPLAYGRVICGSTVVSQGLSTTELVIEEPAPPEPVELPFYEPSTGGE